MGRDERYPNWFLWLWRMGLFGYVIAVVVAIGPVLALAWYVDTRLERIEGELQFEPPRQYSPPDLESRATGIPAEDRMGVRQSVYVPVYSHVYYHGGRPCLLEATLSIRNTDMDRAIYIRSVRYYDTQGELRRTHVDRTIRLTPLETIEFLVEQRDTVGGSGANFIVEWMASNPVSPPLIETVMVGTVGTQGISFARSGIVVSVPPPSGDEQE